MHYKVFLRLFLILFPLSLFAQNLDKKCYSPHVWKEKRIFKKIGKAVADKRIVILGEAAHDGGKTFEYKTKLVQYLVEKEGFNIVALEGGGYFDFQYLNGNIPTDTALKVSYFKAWYPFWSYAKQTKDLITAFEEGKIKGYGMENQPTGLTPQLLTYCKGLLNADPSYQWAHLDSVSLKIISHDTSLDSEQIKELKTEFMRMKTELKHNSIICNSIDNYIAYLEQFLAGFTTYEGQNKGINIRDKQMALNIINYLNEHPNNKIIIWTANFHGAKQIKDIEYGDPEDPLLYNRLTLLGEHLYNEYHNSVYSLAYTSHGTVGSWWKTESDTIPHFSGNLEEQLYNKVDDIGFLDFTNESNKNQVFYSSILGRDNKKGKWMKAFDGVFYIRENEKVYRR